MFYLFDDGTLMFVLGGTFLAGFLPLFIMFIRCPEARAFIKAQMTGGIMIADSDDSATVVYRTAKPLGSGQYMSGPNKYRQRTIYAIPRINNPFISKRFMLAGIRRPIFFHYGGKTVAVNDETLAAIEVTELKKEGKEKEIPENVKKWAEEQHVTFNRRKEVMVKDPETKEEMRKLKRQKMTVPLFLLDPRKLRYYFDRHYDESQYDVLLDQARQDGANSRGGGGGMNMGNIGKFLIVVLIIGAVGLLGIAFLTGAIHL
jgi:hypothetical protein